MPEPWPLKPTLSAPLAIAHEARSHELGRLLDDAAALLWRACGEDSRIGRLADEARWAAFLLHDRIALHAVQEAGVDEHELAIQPLSAIDLVWRGPNRFEADAERGGATARDGDGELGPALALCKATVMGMSLAYERHCDRAHPLLEALRRAEQAIGALYAELDGAALLPCATRARVAASGRSRRDGSPNQRAVGTLLLLRSERLDCSWSVTAGAGYGPAPSPRRRVAARVQRGA